VGIDISCLVAEIRGIKDCDVGAVAWHIAKLCQVISEQTTRIDRLASCGINMERSRLVLLPRARALAIRTSPQPNRQSSAQTKTELCRTLCSLPGERRKRASIMPCAAAPAVSPRWPRCARSSSMSRTASIEAHSHGHRAYPC
jgi:hypothetical protein